MSFGDAIKTCFSKYADFKGRASRPEYWWFFLSYFIAYAVALILGIAVKGLFIPLILLMVVAYFIPLLAAAVRRLHDTGAFGLVVLHRPRSLRRIHLADRLLGDRGEPGSEPVRGRQRGIVRPGDGSSSTPTDAVVGGSLRQLLRKEFGATLSMCGEASLRRVVQMPLDLREPRWDIDG